MLQCHVFTKADRVNVLYDTRRNSNTITGTKCTIFTANEAVIEEVSHVTAAEWTVKDWQFDSESILVEQQQEWIAMKIITNHHFSRVLWDQP